MNDELAKQLIRQMKIMNFWITFFGSIVVVSLVIAGFLLWQVVTFMNDTNRKIDTIRTEVGDSLDVKKKTCDTSSSFGRWLEQNTDICQ